MLSFFPLDVLDEIYDLIESVSETFPIYSGEELILLFSTISNGRLLRMIDSKNSQSEGLSLNMVHVKF